MSAENFSQHTNTEWIICKSNKSTKYMFSAYEL